MDVPLRADPKLGSIELGITAAGTPVEIRERVRIWKLGRDTRPNDGESMADVGERIVELMRSQADPWGGLDHGQVLSDGRVLPRASSKPPCYAAPRVQGNQE